MEAQLRTLLGKPAPGTPAPGAGVRFWEAPEREGWLMKQGAFPIPVGILAPRASGVGRGSLHRIVY